MSALDGLQTETFEQFYSSGATEHTFVAATFGLFACEKKATFLAVNMATLDPQRFATT
jgi:hypothetical protein